MSFTRLSMKNVYKVFYETGMPGYDKAGLAALVVDNPLSIFLPSEYEEITGEKWVAPTK